MSLDPFNSFNPISAPNFMAGGTDPFLLSAQAAASYGLQYQPMAMNQLGSNLGYGIPGTGPFGQIGSMLIAQMMASNGYTFTSMFGAPSSAVMRNRYEMQQMQQASMAAMQRVDGSVLQHRMTKMGINLALQSGASQADANAYGQQWGSVANSLINNPMAMTALNIAGASFGVDIVGAVAPEAGLASGLYRAGLTNYSGGGVFGLAPENVAAMTGRLADYFYPGGAGDPTRLRGFSGRQVGDIAVSLQQAGVLGSYRGDPSKFTGSDQDLYRSELERTGDRSQAVAAVNSEGLKTKLKEATRVFQIAREITGSDDVQQMMQAIQTLTGGGMNVMSASALEGQLSRIQEIARVARISMDQMAFIAQQGSQMAQNVGLSGVVGANAAISMVERATITYAASNRALGGEAGPYNPTQNQIMDQEARQTQAAMGSLMTQRLGAFSGILDQAERVQPGVVNQRIEELRARQASGGRLSAAEAQALAVVDRMQRISSGKGTREDAAAVSGAQGVTDLGEAISTLTGLSAGEARRLVSQDTVMRELGLQKNPEIIGFVAGVANAAERQRQLERALAGSAELNGIRSLNGNADRQRELISALADLSVNYQTGGESARQRANAIQQQFGLSNSEMATAQLLSEGQLNYITGGSLNEIASLKARGEGRRDMDRYRSALERGMASSQALRDLGGTDFTDRLFKVVAGESTVAEALNGIKDEKLRAAFADPLERLSRANFELNNATTQAERDAAIKRRSDAEKRYNEIESILAQTGFNAPTTEKRKALEAERDSLLGVRANADSVIGRHVVSETEMQDLVRQKAQADQDLMGLLQNERTTVGAPAGVTDVPGQPPLPPKGEATASANPKPQQIQGELKITLNDTPLGRGMLEAAERSLPTPVLQNLGVG